MAVLWVTKEAGRFDKHWLDVALIYISISSKIVQAMLAGPNHKLGQKLMVMQG
jgi:ABC-type nitrate/sulfonate/bicarbonate transport system substrate-binding protein